MRSISLHLPLWMQVRKKDMPSLVLDALPEDVNRREIYECVDRAGFESAEFYVDGRGEVANVIRDSRSLDDGDDAWDLLCSGLHSGVGEGSGDERWKDGAHRSVRFVADSARNDCA